MCVYMAVTVQGVARSSESFPCPISCFALVPLGQFLGPDGKRFSEPVHLSRAFLRIHARPPLFVTTVHMVR